MAGKTKLLSTAAASILLSVGVASAQTSVGEGHKMQPESAQHGTSAVQGKGAIHNESRGQSAERSNGRNQTTAESKSEGAAAKKSSTTGQASSAEERGAKFNVEQPKGKRGMSERGKSAATEHGRKAGTTGQASSSDMKNNAAAEKQRGGQANKLNHENAGAKKPSTTGQAPQTEQKAGAQKSGTTGQAPQTEQKAGTQKSGTTGQATQNAQQPGASGKAAVSGQAQVQGANLDQRQVTKVQQTVFARANVPRVENVNFAVGVGTVVPSHVHVVTVPSTLVEIYPEWRGDDYFVVRDEIIIVDHSRRIVAVIPARSHRASASEEIDISELPPDEIREVQIVLIQRGFLHGRADGVFGSETREALVSFQREEGLQASGRIDTRTVSSLGLSGKINIGVQGTSATTGQAPRGNTSQGQMSNAPQEQQNRPQAQQKGEQNPQSNGQRNAPQDQSQAIPNNAKRSTTGQGSQQIPNAQRQGQDQSTPNAQPQHNPAGGSTSPRANEPGPNHKKGEQ